jgi:NADPH:quinone reductase-like Zn-dependent oxidoreductase
VAKKPASLSHAQAAALVLPGVTVTQLLDQHGFEPGQRLLIIGASGGVGHLAVKLAKARGAKSVVGVCSAANAAFVRSCGADAVVAYDAECSETTRDSSGGAKEREIGNETTTPDAVVDELRRIVREDLGGHAFDLVLDAVTSGDARDAGFEYERRVRSAGLVKTPANGVDAHNYVTIGSRPVGWVLAAIKRVTGVNLFARGRELFWIRFPGCASDLAELARVCDGDASASGGRTSVAPAIEATLPLTSEGVAEAFRRLHSRRVRGKIVVEVT